MRVDGVFKRFFYQIDRFLLGELFVGTEARFKVSGNIIAAVFIPQVVAGQQTIDILKKGFGRQRILERKIGVERTLIKALFKIRVLQNALDLGGVDKVVADLRVVQRLDAECVARQEQRFFLDIVNRKGEHTAQTRQHLFLPLLKAVDQHLAVGFGRKRVTLCLQRLAQLLVVVDFTVECENHGLVLVEDRLVACIQVDDGQAPEAHANGVVGVKAVGVGTAMGDDLRHVTDDRFALFGLTGKAADTAHIKKLPSKDITGFL